VRRRPSTAERGETSERVEVLLGLISGIECQGRFGQLGLGQRQALERYVHDVQ
jgi:hypothetical protein